MYMSVCTCMDPATHRWSFVDCLGISYMRLREADEKYKILGPGIQRSWHPALRTCLAQLSTL